MEYNRTSSETIPEYAYTNNTFSLKETEISIKQTVENSFKYLMEVQKSYMGISRFTLNESNLYTDRKGNICISIDKDFIEAHKRKPYRSSSFYNKYFTLKEVNDNPDIFSFIPIVTIDDKSIFSYMIKASLDGRTELMFTNFDYMRNIVDSNHKIEIVFIKNTKYECINMNMAKMKYRRWSLPNSILTNNVNENNVAFIYLQLEGYPTASNVFTTSIDSNGIYIDTDNEAIMKYFSYGENVLIHIYLPDDLNEIISKKQISTRVDNNKKSSIFVIEPELFETYKMPVSIENIFVIKINKNTGEMLLDNTRSITLHYPNIYEIDCDDLDDENYELKVFYFYKKMQEYLTYKNHFKYIHRYLAKKINSSLENITLENTIRKLLYTNDVDTNLQKYFFSIFDYADYDYIYNHGDFFSSYKPYDFDYKISKMREFIDKDPFVLEDYGKRVSTITETYYLYVSNIDLNKRLRNDTLQEAINESQHYYFGEPRYIFAFRNEVGSHLNLRFFIDGLLFTDTIQIYTNDMEYIYIPVSVINNNSYIEIEKFNSYKFKDTVKFTSSTEPHTIEFEKSNLIEPTLYDLYVVGSNRSIIDRSNFKIYALIDPKEYDISDYINDIQSTSTYMMNYPYYEDIETGEIYMELTEDIEPDNESIILGDNTVLVPNESGRLPIYYLKLNKIKIFCMNESLLNTEITFTINKYPIFFNKVMDVAGSPIARFSLGNTDWKKDPSYIRFFHNGRLKQVDATMVDENDSDFYIIADYYAKHGDTTVFDITPYSYNLEYQRKTIPEDFVIRFNGELSKPFSTAYYDVYLNGRKLSDNNIQVITANVIKLFNVHSIYNLFIYRKDRDYEYYGFNKTMRIPLDDLLNSDLISEEDKQQLMDDIIKENHPDMVPGDNSETDIDVQIISNENKDKASFYFDVIIPEYVTRPNTFTMHTDTIYSLYPTVYNEYRVNDRIVIRPNINYDANLLLVAGRKCTDIIERN